MMHVKALFQDLVRAGTGTAVEWAMAELLHNPHMMARAKKEITSVVGKGAAVEESHLPVLPYLDAVVKETHRRGRVSSLIFVIFKGLLSSSAIAHSTVTEIVSVP